MNKQLLYKNSDLIFRLIQAASGSSNAFVGTGVTTASITGSVMSMTNNVHGLSMLVPNWLTTAAGGGGGGPWVVATKTGSDVQVSTGATNTIYYANFITTAQAPGNYLTTAAQSDHTHDYQSTGAYLTTAAASNHTHSNLYQSTGAYLTTAMASNAGSLFLPVGNSTDYATSVLSTKFLTTAQAPGAYLTTAMQSASSSVFMKTGFTTTATAGTAVVATANTDGLKIGVPAFLTTAMLSQNTSLYQSAGAYLTTAMLSANTSAYMSTGERNNYQYTSNSSNNTSVYQALSATTKFAGTGTTAANASITLNSNGLNISVAAPGGGAGVAASIGGGNSTSAGAGYSNITSGTMLLAGGNNITLSQNGAGITIVGPTAGAGDGGNVIAAGGSTAASTGTYVFSNSNGISFSLNGSTITASHNAYTGTTAGWLTTAQPVGAYLTTAALSQNTSNYAGINSGITGGSMTVNTSGVTISLPAYLTTAMLSANTSLYVSVSQSSLFQHTSATGNITSNAFATSNSSLLLPVGNSTQWATGTLSSALMPLAYSSGFQTATLATKFLTTAAVSDHTHSNLYVNTSVSANFLTTAAQSGHTHASAPSITGNISVTSNSSAWSIAIGAYLTTAMLSQNTSLYQSTGAYLTTAMASNQALYSATSQFSASFINTGQTAGFLTTAALSQNTSNYAGLGTSGTNVSITLNTAGITVSVANPVGGGGVQVAGSAASTVTNNVVVFQTGNGITFGLNGSTMTASHNALTTAMASDAGSNFIPIANSTAYQTSVLSTKFLTTAQPAGAYLTTAMASDAGSNFIAIGNSTQWATGTLSSALMPLSYSSGFQTATLATKFLTTAALSGDTTKYIQAWELEGANTAGTSSSLQGTKLFLSGGNNITLSGNSNTIIISAGNGGGGGIAASIGGNSTSAGGGYSNITSGTMIMYGGSNITLSQNGSVVSIVGATANGPASIVFSDANGLVWGSAAAGSTTTITASVTAAAPRRRMIEIIPGEYLTKVVTVSASQVSKRVIFNPFWLDGNGMAASTVRFVMSWVTNATPPSMTYGAGLYSRVNATSYALYDSTTATINPAGSANSAEYSGIRVWDVTGMTKTLTEGPWLLGLYFSGTASGAMNGILYGASAWPNHVGYISGAGSTAGTNNTNHLYQFQGYYSATTAGFPAGVGQSDISGGRAADAFDFYAILKEV